MPAIRLLLQYAHRRQYSQTTELMRSRGQNDQRMLDVPVPNSFVCHITLAIAPTFVKGPLSSEQCACCVAAGQLAVAAVRRGAVVAGGAGHRQVPFMQPLLAALISK